MSDNRFYSFLLTLVVSFFYLEASKLYSQDVHNSQRLVLDRERNPTFLSDFEGKWQAYTTYREQWASIGEPFTTSSAHLVRKFYTPISALKIWGGVGFINDQSGDGKLSIIRPSLQMGGILSTAFGDFEFGFSNQWVAKSFNQGSVTFPSQYDRNLGRFNESLGNGENFSGEQYAYYNLDIGLSWTREINQNWKLRGGFAMQNVTEPKESFLDSDNKKNRGYSLQLLAYHLYTSSLNIEPYLSFYRAGKASETIVGSAFSFKVEDLGAVDQLKPFLYFRTGIGRSSDALILGSRAQLGKFNLGLSYDVNVSSLEIATDYQGGYELSLFYTIAEQKITKRRLPCERF